MPYVKFSKTYKKFVTHLDEMHLRKLLYDLAPWYHISLGSNIKVNDMALLKAFWEQSYLNGQYINYFREVLQRPLTPGPDRKAQKFQNIAQGADSHPTHRCPQADQKPQTPVDDTADLFVGDPDG